MGYKIIRISSYVVLVIYLILVAEFIGIKLPISPYYSLNSSKNIY